MKVVMWRNEFEISKNYRNIVLWSLTPYNFHHFKYIFKKFIKIIITNLKENNILYKNKKLNLLYIHIIQMLYHQ
jgi:hypothetical protein